MSDHSDDNMDSDDFDFKNKKAGKKQEDLKTKKIENQHMDEAVELASDGSQEIPSGEDQSEEEEDPRSKQQQPNPRGGKPAAMNPREDHEDDYENKSDNIPGAYNPADYSHLKVSNEIKDLFKYITRYQPEVKDLESQLRPFVPDYFPAVGEVDAYIKMPRPDNKEEPLGLHTLDEPCLNQSNRAILIQMYRNTSKKTDSKASEVISIKNAEKNPKEIQFWIDSIAKIRKTKQPHSVAYSKPMPEIEDLMQVWPQEIESALGQIKIPSEELDISIEDFSRLACAILDIPVHETGNKTNIVESLHVLFTLYSEFKSNQHFDQNKNNQPQYDQMQLQIN